LVRQTFAKGDILAYEGDVLANVIIVESGRLLRTKLAVSDLPIDRRDRTILVQSFSRAEYLAKSIVIDALESRGRVSGLLHAFDVKDDNPANTDSSGSFATISAENDDAVVWLLPKTALRRVLRNHDCLFLLDALSREIRSGTKSLRGLILRQQQQQPPSQQSREEESTVRVLCYDTANWVSDGFRQALEGFHTVTNHQKDDDKAKWPRIHVDYTTDRLSVRSATYAAGYDAVCIFVNDDANADVLKTLSLLGVRMIALRCAGFDRVDTNAATAYHLTVARVPAYSP
jgi:CRP-like cAMP-binding protein